MRQEITKATKCPTCGHVKRTYRRRFSREMKTFLLKIFQRTVPGGRPIHTRQIYPTQTKASNDGAYLTKWGLVERHRVGEYTVTERGVEFVKRETCEPTWADVCENKVVQWGPRARFDQI